MRIVHAADLHIDSPLLGIERIADAPHEAIRLATREAARALVDLCLQERAALLLLAGDVFDGDWRDFNTGLFFLHELRRLREGGTRVVFVRGNHDAESVLTQRLRLPDGARELSTVGPETVVLEDIGVAVHGQGFPERAVTHNLALDYPAPVSGALNIGLLHTNCTGSAEHAAYAPCTTTQLARHGYQYWALGHVHQTQVLCADPYIVYPGNTQGRHARETGPKGCRVLEVEAGRITRVESRILDQVRWEHLVVQASESEDDCLEAAERRMGRAVQEAGGRPVVARVELAGETPAHHVLVRRRDALREALRQIAANVGGVWIEKLVLETRAPGRPSPRKGALVPWVQDEVERLAGDEASKEALLASVEPALQQVRRLVEPGAIDEEALLHEAAQRLMAELQGSGP